MPENLPDQMIITTYLKPQNITKGEKVCNPTVRLTLIGFKIWPIAIYGRHVKQIYQNQLIDTLI